MPASKKPPVSRTEVADAMRELREAGENITMRSVRERVGRGSLTTISRHVEAVNAGNESPELHLEQFPNRLESLCREMVEVIDELAIERVAHEKGLLEQERRALAEQRNALQHEKDMAVVALEAESKSNDDLRLRLAEAMQTNEGMARELNELRPRAAKAELLNEQQTVRLHEGNEKVKKLEHHIEHSDAQFTKQRQRDADDHARKIAALEGELANIRTSELRLTEQLGNANRDIDKLTLSQQSAHQRAETAEAKQAELQALVGELSIEQNASKKREADREQRLANAVTERDAAVHKHTSLQGQLIEAQSNIEKLRQGGAAESRSVIANLVEHSRRVYELAVASAKKANPELQELGIAQREIERLFRTAD